VTAGKPSPSPNYHLARINQALGIEKPRRVKPRLLGSLCSLDRLSLGAGERPIHLTLRTSVRPIVPVASLHQWQETRGAA
jgi:hypothetical protein